MRPPRTVALLCCLGLLACVDLPKISLISEMDIFGARVGVLGDETRATPKPGESANLALSVIYPELKADDDEFSMAVLECTWPDRYLSVPVCQEFVSGFAGNNQDAGAADNPANNPLAGLQDSFACTDDLVLALGSMTLRCVKGRRDFDFTVSSDVTGPRRLFIGILCRNGDPVAMAGTYGLPTFDCKPSKSAKGKLEIESFYSSATIEYEPTDANRNPDGEPSEVKLDDTVWPVYSGTSLPTAADCATNPALLEVVAGASHKLRIAYPTSAREKVDGEFETLRVSHRATAGDFSRAASYIEPISKPAKDGNLEVTVSWKAPAAEDKGSRLIHFVFGIRDGRGGFGNADRYACRPLRK